MEKEKREEILHNLPIFHSNYLNEHVNEVTNPVDIAVSVLYYCLQLDIDIKQFLKETQDQCDELCEFLDWSGACQSYEDYLYGGYCDFDPDISEYCEDDFSVTYHA